MEMEKYILEHAVVVPTINNVSYAIVSDAVEIALGGYDATLGWGFDFCDLNRE